VSRRWTNDEVDAIRAMVAAGRSFSQIGAEYDVSRNSIASICARFDIRANVKAKADPVVKPKPAPKVIRTPLPIEPELIEQLFQGVEPASPAGPTLLELGPRSCRWPVDEVERGRHIFCGAPAVTGRVWCAQHFALAYTHRAAAA